MELPRVFAKPIEKKINNVQEVYKESERDERMDVKGFIKDLYHSGRIPYMIDFRLVLNNNEVLEDRIATRTDNYIITKSNKKIYINDIKMIEEIKKA